MISSVSQSLKYSGAIMHRMKLSLYVLILVFSNPFDLNAQQTYNSLQGRCCHMISGPIVHPIWPPFHHEMTCCRPICCCCCCNHSSLKPIPKDCPEAGLYTDHNGLISIDNTESYVSYRVQGQLRRDQLVYIYEDQNFTYFHESKVITTSPGKRYEWAISRYPTHSTLYALFFRLNNLGVAGETWELVGTAKRQCLPHGTVPVFSPSFSTTSTNAPQLKDDPANPIGELEVVITNSKPAEFEIFDVTEELKFVEQKPLETAYSNLNLIKTVYPITVKSKIVPLNYAENIPSRRIVRAKYHIPVVARSIEVPREWEVVNIAMQSH